MAFEKDHILHILEYSRCWPAAKLDWNIYIIVFRLPIETCVRQYFFMNLIGSIPISSQKKKIDWFCKVPFWNSSRLVYRIFQGDSIFNFIHYILQYICAKFYAYNKKCTMFSILYCKTRRILYFSCTVYFGTYRTSYIGVCMSYTR